MYPVILRVVVVKPGSEGMPNDFYFPGVKVGKYLILKAFPSKGMRNECLRDTIKKNSIPFRQFFRVKLANTHVDEGNYFIDSENTLARVVTVKDTCWLEDKKFNWISLNGSDKNKAKIQKQIDEVHQFYSTVIPYTA